MPFGIYNWYEFVYDSTETGTLKKQRIFIFALINALTKMKYLYEGGRWKIIEMCLTCQGEMLCYIILWWVVFWPLQKYSCAKVSTLQKMGGDLFSHFNECLQSHQKSHDIAKLNSDT